MTYSNKPSGAQGPQRRLQDAVSAVAVRGPAAQFVAVSALGLAALVLAGAALVGGMALFALACGVLAYAGAVAVALGGLRAGYPHRAIGLCNTVTILRLALVCLFLSGMIAGLTGQAAHGWAMFAVAALAFALDGADGWLARREGYVSAFGARFDVEVDSALALLLAVYAWQSGHVGAYVIILGLPRYLFVIAQYPFPWLTGALPERFSRKVVCVVQIAVLLLVTLPVVSAVVAGVAAGGAALALVWSFGRDIAWLWQARA